MVKQDKLENRLNLIILFALLLPAGNASTEDQYACPTAVELINSRDVFISDYPAADANTARDICGAFNGQLLAATERAHFRSATDFARNKLKLGDIQTISYKSLNSERTRFVYQTNAQNTEIQPSEANIESAKSISFFSRPNGAYNRSLTFCKIRKTNNSYFDKWEIRENSNCRDEPGWVEDFVLYHGNEEALSRKKYHHYRTSENSSLISDETLTAFSNDSILFPIYAPDFSIFIGIRSDYNETRWFWPDGNEATVYAPLSESSMDKCQQASLNFNQGAVDSYAEACSGKRGLFSCEIKHLEIQATDIPCNDTALRFNWTAEVELFNRMKSNNLVVNIEINNVVYNASIMDGEILAANLFFNKSYSINTTMKSLRCPIISDSGLMNVTTGYGRADEITEAWVNNSTTPECNIEWRHNFSDENIIRYEISLNEAKVDQSLTLDSSQSMYSNPILNFSIDFKELSPNSIYSFQIRPYTCYGMSNPTRVDGKCLSQPKESLYETLGSKISATISPNTSTERLTDSEAQSNSTVVALPKEWNDLTTEVDDSMANAKAILGLPGQGEATEQKNERSSLPFIVGLYAATGIFVIMIVIMLGVMLCSKKMRRIP